METLQNSILNTETESLLSDENEIVQCGEIFFSECGTFFLDCLFCSQRFEKTQFFDHFLKVHHKFDESSISDTNISNQYSEEEFCTNFEISNQEVEAVKGVVFNGFEYDQRDLNFEKNEFENYLLNYKDSNHNLEYYEKLGGDLTENEKSDYDFTETSSEICAQAKNTHGHYSCNVCYSKFKFKKDLTTHRKTKCGFKCEFCSKIFFKQPTLRNHLNRNHIQNKIEQYSGICDICGKYFKNLQFHMEKHDPARKTYPCNKCDKIFLRKNTLEYHYKLKHIKEKPFICEIDFCNRGFVDQRSLERHRALHGDRKFECSICHKKFVFKSKMDEHVKYHHVQGKIYECSECLKCFRDPWTLKSHLRGHKKEKPFQCDECDAKFAREINLMWHKKTHWGGKDCICKYCNEKFKMYTSLFLHMKKTHNIKYKIECKKDSNIEKE